MLARQVTTMKEAGDATSGMVQGKLDKALEELTAVREKLRGALVSNVNQIQHYFLCELMHISSQLLTHSVPRTSQPKTWKICVQR